MKNLIKLIVNDNGDYILIKDGKINQSNKYVLFNKEGKELSTNFENSLIRIHLV